MKALPSDFDENRVLEALKTEWTLDVEVMTYLAVGAGSHHWSVTTRFGHSYFVSVDELEAGGEGRAAHSRALEVCKRLSEHGLEFVIAPVASNSGEIAHAFVGGHVMAVYPHVNGTSGAFADPMDASTMECVVETLVRLHEATDSVRDLAPVDETSIPSRRELQRALVNLHSSGTSPYPHAVTALLQSRASLIERSWNDFDIFASSLRRQSNRFVITHGEPHLGNVLRQGSDVRLVDWETARLSLPERDLWLVARRNPNAVDFYQRRSGRDLDEYALRMFELRWWLTDIALFLEDSISTTLSVEDRNASIHYLLAALEAPPS
jgi:hypothetical protein